MRCEALDRGSEKWTETLKDGGTKQIEAVNFESWVAYVAWRHEADSSHEWPGKDDEDVWAGYALIHSDHWSRPGHAGCKRELWQPCECCDAHVASSDGEDCLEEWPVKHDEDARAGYAWSHEEDWWEEGYGEDWWQELHGDEWWHEGHEEYQRQAWR